MKEGREAGQSLEESEKKRGRCKGEGREYGGEMHRRKTEEQNMVLQVISIHSQIVL